MTFGTRGIVKSRCWFVPLHKLNKTEGANLKLAISELADRENTVNSVGLFTVSLESFLVKNNFDDGRSGNDLLARSRVQYGNELPIEPIQFFAKDIPSETVIDNLPSEHIFATQEHEDKNRVFIEVEIIEIDKGLEIDSDTSNSIDR